VPDAGFRQRALRNSAICNPQPAIEKSAVESVGGDFIWSVGVECSVLPHIQVDQFQWTQHDRFWGEDFRMIRNTFGPVSVRYGLPWNMIEPAAGKFDWGWADERVDFITRELGLKLMLDVVHFGTPLWLRQAAGDPEFPEALERLAAALAARYGDRVHTFCPFNEPLITALFSGDFGFWPPHSRRWRGYMPVLSRIVQGTLRAIRAIRKNAPDASVLLCDSCEHHQTAEEALAPDIRMRNTRRFVVMDLLTGRMDKHHPLYPWLTTYGFAETDLDWIRANSNAPDIIGLDYYSHTETELELAGDAKRQKKPANPLGLYGCARQYWDRYGIPLMLTETSEDGADLDRELWLEQTIADSRRLREEGVPLLGYTWWPCFDNVDWDGALLHHIGKIHKVGLFSLKRQKDGILQRSKTALADRYAEYVHARNEPVGELAPLSRPALDNDEESLGAVPSEKTPRIAFEALAAATVATPAAQPAADLQATSDEVLAPSAPVATGRASTGGNGAARRGVAVARTSATSNTPNSADWGIIVFSHLRWGFVWQRPQQFVSRYARKHPVLFVEEPMFDQDGGALKLLLHRVMPNVVVACPHFPKDAKLSYSAITSQILKLVQKTAQSMNTKGQFTSPLLYYYNPMDVGWSMGQFNECGVVYDCMDELSQFKGAPKELLDNERRLLERADVVFTGGYQMYRNKSKCNSNCHFFGCGVDVAHFAQARQEDTSVPPDIDFMAHPVLGWFGVIDERVDYPLLDKIAETHPEWSVAMIGPVVKVDTALLPHRPNLFWLGARDYRVLPNYCKAFDLCLMPFAINSATQYINPTKALEYMATGRPVVSTAIADVIHNFKSVVYIADNHKTFIKACEDALRKPDAARLQRGLALAQNNSWDTVVARMLGLMGEAVARRARVAPASVPAGRNAGKSPRLVTDEGLLEINWSYPSVAGS
jgi:beta-glucosidase/6-phospho-beta-glucosidase/beta-galactosidase